VLFAAAILGTGMNAIAAPAPTAPVAKTGKQAVAACETKPAEGKRKLIPGACQDPRSGSPDAERRAIAECEASVKKYEIKQAAGACNDKSTQMNIKMFTAQREACTRAHFVASAVQQVQRCPENDDR
jgi:hypothetical protein